MAERRSTPGRSVLVGAVLLVGVVAAVLAVAGAGAVVSAHPNDAGTAVVQSRSVVPAGTQNSVVATISGISAPQQAVYDPSNGYLYIAQSSNNPPNWSNLTIVNGATNSIVTNFSEPNGEYASLQPPAYDSDNHDMYLPDDDGSGVGNITVLSGTDTLVTQIVPSYNDFPTTPVYDSANQDLYVAGEGCGFPEVDECNVTVVATASNTVHSQVLVGQGPTTPLLDSANGDLYVPDSDSLSTNLTIINTATNAVSATLTTLQSPTLPVYDPENGHVYVADTGSSNVTVLSGTSIVATWEIQNWTQSPAPPPAVDTSNGDLYFGDSGSDTIVVMTPSGTMVANLSTGDGQPTYEEAATYDPYDGDVYVPGNDINGNGNIYVVNATTNTLISTIIVGADPSTPTLDPATDNLYVANGGANNVSVIGGGPSSAPPPGTYTVTFTESGLPSGAWWTIGLNGTVYNRTTSSIMFDGVADGSHTYSIGAWDDEDECVLDEASETGTVTVSGAPASVAVAFSCAGTIPPLPGGSASGFLGLAGDLGIILIGVVVVVVVVIVLVVLAATGKLGGGGATGPSGPPLMPPPPPPPPPPPSP
jgi:DNA-binding beta-propeller fold protein YncE